MNVWERIKRLFTGPDIDLPDTPKPPVFIDPPIPYKPGSEKALWGLPEPRPSLLSRLWGGKR